MFETNNEFCEFYEEKIPFGERLTIAITNFFSTIAHVITTTVLIPITFMRILFKSSRRMIRLKLPNGSAPPSSNGPDEEDWRRAHREEYGSDE